MNAPKDVDFSFLESISGTMKEVSFLKNHILVFYYIVPKVFKIQGFTMAERGENRDAVNKLIQDILKVFAKDINIPLDHITESSANQNEDPKEVEKREKSIKQAISEERKQKEKLVKDKENREKEQVERERREKEENERKKKEQEDLENKRQWLEKRHQMIKEKKNKEKEKRDLHKKQAQLVASVLMMLAVVGAFWSMRRRS